VLPNQHASNSQTYVACLDRQAGYYSLVVGVVAPDEEPPRTGKGLARHPIPVLILVASPLIEQTMGRAWAAPS
jgi:hypothetical protein